VALRAPSEHCGDVGIPNEESYLRTSYFPTGHATGWRRIVMLTFFGVLALAAVVASIVGIVSLVTSVV
jgi:hypothetical protein